MKNKVINLFNDKEIIPNEDVKYSGLIEKFLAPFENVFPEDYYMEDIFEYAINAWNFANLSMIVPKNEFENIISSAPKQDWETSLLKKMIANKISDFKEYDRFISDFEITEVEGKPTLTVISETSVSYFEKLMDNFEHDASQDDFEENYIDRFAIVLKPQKPFFDWINTLYPNEETTSTDRANIYLVDDGIENLEKWLHKKFDKFFMIELNDWHTNKKEWPQKRNLKMFKEWFQVDVSNMVYDLEKRPIHKGEPFME